MPADPGDVPTRRRSPRRLLIGANIFVSLCVLLAGFSYLYIRFQWGRIPTEDLCKVLRNCGDDDPKEPMNVLMVGSDSRKNLSPAERRQFGSESEVGGQRSDTMLIMRVEPGPKRAAILSIPRDLAVIIAGEERRGPQRINTAFENGPEGLIRTIQSALGIEIDHYAQVDFNGFRSLVDIIGGVTVHFPAPARDRLSGLDIRTPGCVELNGDGALKYVRSREYQYFESGRWRTDPTGDLGRIQRQQDFIRRVLRKASRRARNPLTINALINNAVGNVTRDESFSTRDVFRVGKRFRSLDPETVEMLTLPTVGARVSGASVLRLKQPEATELINHFLGRTPPPPVNISPSTVRVRVLNGSGSDGQASDAAGELQQFNFNVAGTGDADSFQYADPVIRYGRGQQAKAQLLKTYVVGNAQLEEDTTIRGVDLVLITGSGFRGIRAPSAAPPPPPPPGPAKAPPPPRGGPAQPAC